MAGQVVLSANDPSPVTALGSTYIDYDLETLLGPRAYVYIRNHDSSGMTAGLAVRQRSDIFGTEGSQLTGDANTVLGEIKDANLAAPLATAGYIPDTLDRALYWSAADTAATPYHGKVRRNSATVLYLEDPPGAAISTVVYTIWKPFAFIIAAVDDTLSIGGVAQSSITAGYYGWVQYGGFGYAYVVSGGAADGLGCIPGGTAGYGKKVTAGTDDGYIYMYPVIDDPTAAVYLPAMIVAPYMHRYPILP